MLEIDVAFLHDEWQWSRPKAVVVTTVGLMIVGSFSALSFGPLADDKWLGRTFFDWVDYLTANLYFALKEEHLQPKLLARVRKMLGDKI